MKLINSNNLYGTVDLLILRTLSFGGPRHGLAIADEIHRLSGEYLNIEEGALYPALHRLQRAGLLRGEWKVSEKQRRARFYEVTPEGRKELKRALLEWKRHTGAVSKVLKIAWAELR